jgi:hypothetical protein
MWHQRNYNRIQCPTEKNNQIFLYHIHTMISASNLLNIIFKEKVLMQWLESPF